MLTLMMLVPDDVANLITGIASGRYGYEAKPMKKDEFDDRYMITVTRPNPKIQISLIKLGRLFCQLTMVMPWRIFAKNLRVV